MLKLFESNNKTSNECEEELLNMGEMEDMRVKKKIYDMDENESDNWREGMKKMARGKIIYAQRKWNCAILYYSGRISCYS